MIITKELYALNIERMRTQRRDPLAEALLEMLEFDLERVKNLLVNTPPGGFELASLQGEAQAYKKYLKYLKGKDAPT